MDTQRMFSLKEKKVENGFYRLDTNNHTFLFQIKTK